MSFLTKTKPTPISKQVENLIRETSVEAMLGFILDHCDQRADFLRGCKDKDSKARGAEFHKITLPLHEARKLATQGRL